MGLRQVISGVAAVLLITAVVEPAHGQVGWTWPLEYSQPAIVHAFDPPAEPWQPGHRGVDLAGIEGEAVYAAGAGVVTYAGLVAGLGVVSVNHGELRTTYQPVTATVRVGERVQAGQQVGSLAVAGSHCAPSPCLHWGLLQRDVYLDPTSLVPPTGRARLLPLGASAVDPGAASSPAARGMPAQPTASVSEQAAVGALAGIP